MKEEEDRLFATGCLSLPSQKSFSRDNRWLPAYHRTTFPCTGSWRRVSTLLLHPITLFLKVCCDDQYREPRSEAPCQKCCNHHHGKELSMWCFAESTTLFLLFLMLAVIHLNWLVQQRPERPICSFPPLRHNVRCHNDHSLALL